MLFAPLSAQTRRLLDGIPSLIDKIFPLPGRFRSALPKDVAELSRLLTSGRGERGLSYLGRPNLLSAYLRYFLPWNLYRLCRLLPGLGIALAAHDRIADLGCGPLTLAAALWICRPDLRSVPLEFHCIDRSGPALDAGKKFFAALAGENSPWKLRTARGDINEAKKTPAALVCAVNVFNEMYGDISRNGTCKLQHSADKAARLLESHASDSSAILVMEPGFPRCGEFISLLRGVFLEGGRRCRRPLAPCPHDTDCPFPGGNDGGGKKRWCHFAFETDDAPAALHRLSQAARLPKERAVLSFLYAAPAAAAPAAVAPAIADVAAATNAAQTKNTAQTTNAASAKLRAISDAFFLPPNRSGRYCCSHQGLVLLVGGRNAIEKAASGALVEAVISEERDPKSGAFIAENKEETLTEAQGVRRTRREEKEFSNSIIE